MGEMALRVGDLVRIEAPCPPGVEDVQCSGEPGVITSMDEVDWGDGEPVTIYRIDMGRLGRWYFPADDFTLVAPSDIMMSSGHNKEGEGNAR